MDRTPGNEMKDESDEDEYRGVSNAGPSGLSRVFCRLTKRTAPLLELKKIINVGSRIDIEVYSAL